MAGEGEGGACGRGWVWGRVEGVKGEGTVRVEGRERGVGFACGPAIQRRQVKTSRGFNEGDCIGAVSIVRGHCGREVSAIRFLLISFLYGGILISFST